MTMNRRKNFFNFINKYFLYYLVIQTLFLIVEGEDEDCTSCSFNTLTKKCESTTGCTKCRPHLGTEECYYCKNITDNDFYSIGDDGTCTIKESCQNKIVEETNECVSQCFGGTYQLGDDYCTWFCTEAKNRYNPYLNICKCKYYFKIEEEGQMKKKKYKCLSDTTNIDTEDCNYFDYETKECISEDSCKKKKVKVVNEGEKTRCSNECFSGEYYYKNGETEYCSTTHPTDLYCHKNEVTNIFNCAEACYDNEDIYDGNICTKECLDTTKKIKIDLSVPKKKLECSTEVNNNDSSNIYYKYGTKYYFRNCSDTQQLKLFNNHVTYNYEKKGNDENIEYECVVECPSGTLIDEKTNSCVVCTTFYYGKKCKESCEENEYYINDTIPAGDDSGTGGSGESGTGTSGDSGTGTSSNSGTSGESSTNGPPYQCVKKCPIDYFIDHINKICLKKCPQNTYTNHKSECVNSCKKPVDINSLNSEEGYIIFSDDRKTKNCSASCYYSGKRYNYINHNNTCIKEKCKDENLFSAYDNPYTCYNSCSEIGQDYIYEKDYICYKTQITCDSYYYNDEKNTMKCLTYTGCLQKSFKYTKDKQCRNDCDPGDYRVEPSYGDTGTLVKLGACLSDPNDCISGGFKFYNNTKKICKTTCDEYKTSDDNPAKNENGETCFSTCPSNYPYKKENGKLCLERCDNYYYGKTCSDDDGCGDKYHFEDSKECLDSCKINNKYYYVIKNSTDKICYYSCPNGLFVESASFDQAEPYKCVTECNGKNKFYYEETKICRDSCDILYKSQEENNRICVTQCPAGQYVNKDKFCVDKCEGSTPYILKQKLSNTNPLEVEKCVSICPTDYTLKSNSTNYCLKECPISESYEYDGKCYNKCKKGAYADEIANKCYTNGCPSDFKYYKIDEDGVYICKKKCLDTDFISKEGECVEKCKNGQNFIGGNNLCLDKCTDSYGKYYYKEEEVVNSDHPNTKYTIYRCLHSCPENLLTVIDTNECVSDNCPPDSGYYKSPNNICYKKCDSDISYPFSTIDNENKLVCAKKCHDNQPNYNMTDKICGVGCSEPNGIIDYDNACVSECKNTYYKFLDKEEKKCVNKCPPEKYVKDGSVCVNTISDCTANSYIEGNECRTECEPNHFSKLILDTTEKKIECLTKCDSGTFYYESGPDKNKCLGNCTKNHFVIVDTQKCVSSCPSDYKTYYFNGLDSAVYKRNTCVKSCPTDKPYIFGSNCVSDCPSTYKYHIEGQPNCLSECPKNTKINGNECKSFCDNPKFLSNDNKTCIDDCSKTKYKYYVEGLYYCIDKCPDGYFIDRSDSDDIDSYKCVLSCSNETDYLKYYESLKKYKCVDRCEDFDYINENNKTCVTTCDGEYPFYEERNGQNFCINDCNYLFPDGKCKGKCDTQEGTEGTTTYKYYNYENKTCLKKCPYYQMDINEEKYKHICYNKCPESSPYSNIDSCSKNCELFINYTTNECQDNCDKMKFESEETDENGNHFTFCINDCDELGLFKMGPKICVKQCTNNKVSNFATKTCECEKFYYINEEKEMICLSSDEDLNSCKISGQCLYILYGTYQYIKECNCENCALSFDEKYCYNSVDQYPKNTKKEENNNKLECEYNKYYEVSSELKICLGKDESCPLEYKYLQDGKKCVKKCEDNFVTYNNSCLINSCEDTKKWYIYESEIFCLDNCNNDYPYLNEETRQCVKDCQETENFIHFDRKCVLSCDQNTILKKSIKNILDNGEKEYFYECAYSCTGDFWYRDEADGHIICNNDLEKKTCEDFVGSKPNLIKDTNECTANCLSYKFHNECYNSCNDMKKYYDYEIIVDEEKKECNCKYLWKIVEGKKICMDKSISVCYKEEGLKLLHKGTRQCISSCPVGSENSYTIEFNNTCYDECPPNSQLDDSSGECKCKNKWYQYKDGDSDIVICLGENDDCPKDFYPYVDETNECKEKCENYIFNYKCYQTCPEFTEEDGEDSKTCKCKYEENEEGKVFWYKYVNEGKIFYKCGLTECPSDRKYKDENTKECLYLCPEDKFHFQGFCYEKCPDDTKPINELSKECVVSFNFSDPQDMSQLKENVRNNIGNIYKKTSDLGLVYSINNSTMQIYGVNKNRKPNTDFLIRSNLTYIDFSNCINKLYEQVTDNQDLVVVKYDLGDKSNSANINPVEYQVMSQTGQNIDLGVCGENSIIISYPLSNILKNFASNSKRLRNLQEDDKNILNIGEKFYKGKDIYLEDEEIDSFNSESKLYTDMCYPFELNGKDLILEDRFNYLFPEYSLCESNCIYNRTDFIAERVICFCSPRTEVDFGRPFELQKTDANVQKSKDNQKGSVLKCLSKVKKVSNSFGLIFGLIIIFVEIGLTILTFLYNYKIFVVRIKDKYDVDEVNNIETENMGSLNSYKKDTKKTNEELNIKTSERNLEAPPRKSTQLNIKSNTNNNSKNKNKNNKNNDDNDENKKKEGKKSKKASVELEKENVIENIRKINVRKETNILDEHKDKISSSNSEDIYSDKNSMDTIKEMEEDESILDAIKMEEKLLRVDFEFALNKNKADSLVMILTEILDKIYVIKAIFFIHKYELVTLYVSLYLLWHFLLVSFLSLFYNNSALHNIWIKDDYPNTSYYLSFGFVSSLLIFIIYRGLYFLINNDKQIQDLDSLPKDNKNEINENIKKLIFWAKIKFIIFYAVDFILLIIFFLYLIAFCGIYNATMGHLIESYGIALVEILVIKVLYGLVLGILRKISLVHRINILYKIVMILDKYVA